MDELIEPKPTRVIFCYSEWQDNYDKLKAAHNFIDFHEGAVDVTATQSDEKSLVILDDLMDKWRHCRALHKAFTPQRHFGDIYYSKHASAK